MPTPTKTTRTIRPARDMRSRLIESSFRHQARRLLALAHATIVRCGQPGTPSHRRERLMEPLRGFTLSGIVLLSLILPLAASSWQEAVRGGRKHYFVTVWI